jgi:hypothetical protein
MLWIYLKATLCGLIVTVLVFVWYLHRITGPWSEHRATGIGLIKAITIPQPLFWLMLLCIFTAAWLFYTLTYKVPVTAP